MFTPRSPRRARRLTLGSLLVVSTLALAACGSDDDGDDEGMDPADGAGDTSMPAPGTDADAMPDLTPVSYVIPLTVEEEVPAPMNVPEGATGTATLTYDPATMGISGTVTTSGLTGLPVAAHIHEQVAGEDTGPPIITLIDDGNGTGGYVVPSDAVLDENQAESLETGLLYVNVHTEANPAGEIRGQIVEQDEEETEVETETEIEVETETEIEVETETGS